MVPRPGDADADAHDAAPTLALMTTPTTATLSLDVGDICLGRFTMHSVRYEVPCTCSQHVPISGKP